MNTAELLGPLRETALETVRLVRHLGERIDAMSLDLARDLGAVTRDAQAFANLAQDRATTLYRATPRAAKLAQVGTALLARHRWLRLAAVASGADGLREADHRDLARRTMQAAAQLRGGIAKLGQLASCRPDLIGPVWASELAALQDDVPPVDSAAIRARVEAELDRPLAEVFATFDDTPLAAASLAQVHAATLLDGTSVAVKVQVPGIEDVIEADIAALRTIAGAFGEVPGVDLPMLADELTREERAAYARLVLAIGAQDQMAAGRELAALGFVADAPEQLVAATAALIGAMRPGAAVSELDWEATFAAQIARAKQLSGLTIPRSFVLLGRVLATIAGLLAAYRPAIQLHPIIARSLFAAAAP
ncbi:MAG TPA: AarF/UbiB family protein [Kofleriaceae bacterium]|nr:AarF/UbiB family protein [Kofleriaceae bacterium]